MNLREAGVNICVCAAGGIAATARTKSPTSLERRRGAGWDIIVGRRPKAIRFYSGF